MKEFPCAANDLNQVESHKRAAAATASDKFKDEIIPVSTKALRGGAKINFKGIFGKTLAFDHPVYYGAQSHTQSVSFSAYAMVGFVPRTHSVGESAEWNGAGAHTNYRVYKYGNSIVVENIDSTL
ncbi:hypothetical protein ACFE04_029677 [Oxalis oulophora]